MSSAQVVVWIGLLLGIIFISSAIDFAHRTLKELTLVSLIGVFWCIVGFWINHELSLSQTLALGGDPYPLVVAYASLYIVMFGALRTWIIPPRSK